MQGIYNYIPETNHFSTLQLFCSYNLWYILNVLSFIIIIIIIIIKTTCLGFDSRRYQIFCVVVGLERGPLSLVRSIEELLE